MAEITDRSSLERWLDTRPEDTRAQDARLIAARAALRALPYMRRALDQEAEERRAAILLPSFWAMAVASRAGNGPRQATEGRKAAASSAAAAASAAASVRAAAAAASVRAAAASFRAASSAASFRAASSAADATTAADAAADAAAVSGDAAIWRAVDRDAKALEAGADHQDLNQSALWLDSDDLPMGWTANWTSLKDHLTEATEGWDWWIAWYEDILAGRPRDQALELKIINIPEETWKAGPEPLNKEIARIVAAHQADQAERVDTGGPRPPISPLPPGGGPHDYDPVTAGLGDLTIVFDGSLADERVEAELSRFARLARGRLLEIAAGRDTPIFVGNRYQVDHLDLQRVSVGAGSVEGKWVVRITLVAALWGMAATYSELKEELTVIQADAEAAIAWAVEAFSGSLPENPPLAVSEKRLIWRPEADVLDEIMDKERQSRLQAAGGDPTVH